MDAESLYEGMKRAAKLGLLVAVHAEDDALATKFTAAQVYKGKHDAKAWLASRPVEVELAAIKQATEFAGETGCALHIVHVSSPEGLALIAEARAQRVDVTAETCSHYLLLNDKDVAKLGAPAKCAPPIRDEKRRQAMWRELRAGNIQTIGSDHSPSPPDMKTSKNFFEIWGGIGGVQHGFQLLMNEVAATADKDLPLLAAVLARNVARRFPARRPQGPARRRLRCGLRVGRIRPGPHDHGGRVVDPPPDQPIYRAQNPGPCYPHVRAGLSGMGRRQGCIRFAQGTVSPSNLSLTMPDLFGHTRARIAARHALLTPQNHVSSTVPGIVRPPSS